jgi:hypothetical protein
MDGDGTEIDRPETDGPGEAPDSRGVGEYRTGPAERRSER